MVKKTLGVVIVVAVVLLSSCTTTTKVEKINSKHQKRELGCAISFYKNAEPPGSYEVLGKIESHIKKNLFFGGKVELEEEGYKELRSKACELGGYAVVIDDYITSSAAEMTHIHFWATVLKAMK